MKTIFIIVCVGIECSNNLRTVNSTRPINSEAFDQALKVRTKREYKPNTDVNISSSLNNKGNNPITVDTEVELWYFGLDWKSAESFNKNSNLTEEKPNNDDDVKVEVKKELIEITKDVANATQESKSWNKTKQFDVVTKKPKEDIKNKTEDKSADGKNDDKSSQFRAVDEHTLDIDARIDSGKVVSARIKRQAQQLLNKPQNTSEVDNSSSIILIDDNVYKRLDNEFTDGTEDMKQVFVRGLYGALFNETVHMYVLSKTNGTSVDGGGVISITEDVFNNTLQSVFRSLLVDNVSDIPKALSENTDWVLKTERIGDNSSVHT